MSLGVVVDPQHLSVYGATAEQQYDRYLADEPSLRQYTQGAARVTPVMKYQNYQLLTEQLHGPGRVMVGDAAGFLDPVFSTGLYLGMKGAFGLASAIDSGSPGAFDRFQRAHQRELKLWQRVIDIWYDGTLFNLHRAGRLYQKRWYGRLLLRRMNRRTIRVLTGQPVNRMSFNFKVIQSMLSLGTLLRDPGDLRVK